MIEPAALVTITSLAVPVRVPATGVDPVDPINNWPFVKAVETRLCDPFKLRTPSAVNPLNAIEVICELKLHILALRLIQALPVPEPTPSCMKLLALVFHIQKSPAAAFSQKVEALLDRPMSTTVARL